jgi:SAM-dependent methyltransferase
MTSAQSWQAALGGSQPAAYQRYLVPAIFAAWVDDLLNLAAVGIGSRVLDVACGTGVVTRTAAERSGVSGYVVGLDINRDMLAVARSIPVAGKGIEWREGDAAAALPFPDHTFDAVVCAQGLQFFPDRLAGLREMRRVLVANGHVALGVWRAIDYNPGFAVLSGVLATHVAAGMVDAPFTLPDAEQLRQLLAEAGFRDIAIRTETKPARFASAEAFVTQYAAGSPLSVRLAQVDAGTMASIVQDMDEQLQRYMTPEGLTFPLESHLATARA